MLGYCMSCHRLKAIVPKSTREGYRVDYRPVPHDVPALHRGCGGEVEILVDLAWCPEHPDRALTDDEIEPGHPCDGHERIIR